MWLDDDQDKVDAWLDHKASVCPECGTAADDWVDERGRHRDDPKWEAVAVRCHGCSAIAAAMADVPQGQRGVHVMLRPADRQG